MCDPAARRFAALLARERAACEAFVDTHYPGVYRFFLWLARDRDIAADLTQETFVGFWGSLDRLVQPGDEDLRAWLYGIARNRWRKRLRVSHRAWEGLEDAELRPDREALVLRVFQDLSYAQIGEILGIREGLARWRVHRARVWLRSALQPGCCREKTGAAV